MDRNIIMHAFKKAIYFYVGGTCINSVISSEPYTVRWNGSDICGRYWPSLYILVTVTKNFKWRSLTATDFTKFFYSVYIAIDVAGKN